MEEQRSNRGRAENPMVVALMREQLQVADSFTPVQYDLRKSVGAAEK